MSVLMTLASSGMALGGAVVAAASLERGRRDRLRWEAELVAARRAAVTDPLTGLVNRAGLESELAIRLRASRPLTVALLDLDLFKQVNDTLGHAVGDQVLVGTAQRLLDGVSEHAKVCRLGGDEFALLLPMPVRAAMPVVERIVRAVAQPHRLRGLQVQVGTSAGVAGYEPGLTGDEMLRRADMALYRAKDERAATGIPGQIVVHDEAAPPPQAWATARRRARDVAAAVAMSALPAGR